ncbi:hypothetical protein GGR53DRAFT_388977 [Hypoxylon sp. FL1150]|nr:hypothetical protein GGR53DRAFT_388977 [Hypoxylon sp. FL1150]
MMAGNQGAFQFNGYRSQVAPSHPGTGGRPAGSMVAHMHPSLVPTRTGLPANLARGPFVEISEVSRGLKTVDGMKNELTEYAIFRFEKMQVQNRYGDDGRPLLPTWDRAIRTRVLGLSSGETARQIQRLNRDTRPLVDKLNTISQVLQRQIAAAQELLTSQNPDLMNYQWVLTQIDYQLREIGFHAAAPRENHSLHGKLHGPTGKRYHSRANGHRRKPYERISLTAHSKRTPRSNVDIPTLYEAKQRASFLMNNHNVHSSPSNGQRPLPVGPKPLGGAVPAGPDGARDVVPPAATAHLSKPGLGGGAGPACNVALGNIQNREEALMNHNTMKRGSGYSDGSSSDGSFDTQATSTTSNSSASLNSDDNNRQAPGDGWIRPEKGHGIRDENEQRRDSPRHYAIPEHQYNPNNEPRLSSTPGRHPLSKATDIDIDRARDYDCLAGIRDGRGEAWFAQQRAIQGARRLRPKPRIIREARPPNRRHLEPQRFDGRESLTDEMNRFGRLSLDAEDGYDTVFRRTGARRRTEFEYLLQRGSVLDDDPFDKRRSSYARDVTDDSDSDLSLPPRGNRSFRY